MKVLVIGGTGHIGRFLTPLLVQAGHEVVVLTSGRTPFPDTKDWESVQRVKASYKRDQSDWQDTVIRLKAEVVIDIIGSDLHTLYRIVKGNCKHLLACGSIWMFGEARTVPTPDETQGPSQSEGYAWRYGEMLKVKKQAATDGIAFTAIMPPNICGPGKIPLDTMGGRDIEIHRGLSQGKEVVLPAPGSTLIGPCDARDIASAFVLAVDKRDSAAGEIFNVGSAYALTSEQFVKTYADIYGVDIPIQTIQAAAAVPVSVGVEFAQIPELVLQPPPSPLVAPDDLALRTLRSPLVAPELSLKTLPSPIIAPALALGTVPSPLVAP